RPGRSHGGAGHPLVGAHGLLSRGRQVEPAARRAPMSQDRERIRLRRGRGAALAAVLGLVLFGAACATLSTLLGIQEPRFAVASGRTGPWSLGAPTITPPRGSATMRVWAQVTNPNAFGLTLSTLNGKLALQGGDLVDVRLPLGLPMYAAADTVIPLDLTFG